jgi:DMSO/TMAO reductase YedYZ molybdopterin-dependent catalytic subunit
LATTLQDRTPPGQTLTTKWPVLHYGEVPRVTEESFRLRVFGAVERPLEWTFAELKAMPSARTTSDFHCVTTWSKLDNAWEGVRFSTVLERARVKPSAKYAMIHGSDGYYTNVPVGWLNDSEVLFAWSHDGQPLSPEHGGPLRLVVPKLYAWKSAKWVSALEFLELDRRGYWEERGYHNRGEPFAEERYSYQETD